MRQCISIIVQ